MNCDTAVRVGETDEFSNPTNFSIDCLLFFFFFEVSIVSRENIEFVCGRSFRIRESEFVGRGRPEFTAGGPLRLDDRAANGRLNIRYSETSIGCIPCEFPEFSALTREALGGVRGPKKMHIYLSIRPPRGLPGEAPRFSSAYSRNSTEKLDLSPRCRYKFASL